MSFQVSKDDRSDIESSSEEEAETTSKERLKTASSRGENGTNGHFGSKHWSQNHNNWWRLLHVALCTKNSCPRNIVTGLFLIPEPHSNTKTDKTPTKPPCCGTFETRWQILGHHSGDDGAVMTLWPLREACEREKWFSFPRFLVLGAEKTFIFHASFYWSHGRRVSSDFNGQMYLSFQLLFFLCSLFW